MKRHEHTPEQDLEARADLFKALGHPARLLIVNLFDNKPRHVEELAVILGLSPATISHHLSRLRDDGWAFLAGDAGNPLFNQGVNRQFGAFFLCHPQDWDGQLPAIFAPQEPIPCRRRHYVGRAVPFDWRAVVPDGFAF